MNTKLTLTINETLIAKSKEYAKEKGRSLSSLIENYLKLLTKQKTTVTEIQYTPTVKSLYGSFNAPDDFDYKKALTEELSKKYL